MAVTIDNLNSTVLPSRDHVFPAMKDGITVKLSVGQILDFVIGDAPVDMDTLGKLADAIMTVSDALADVDSDLANKASLNGVETLTNKTLNKAILSSPSISSPTGEFLRGTLFGLTMANNAADVANDIDISVGFAGSDGAVPSLMTLPSSITKRMDAPWALGSNNGGWLDGSSMPNGTGHFFLIRRSDTGVVDVAASASLNPTLPNGFDQKRRIGSIPRSSGAMKTFVQLGDYFDLVMPSPDVVELNPGTSAGLKTISVPVGIKVMARIAVGMRAGNGLQDNTGEVIVSSPDVGDYQPLFNNAFSHALLIQNSAEGKNAAPIDVFTNTLAQVRRRVAASAAGTAFYINTRGWVDNRGRLF